MILKGKRTVALLLTGSFMIVFILTSPQSSTASEEEFVGNETCLDCHDDIAEAFSENVHMKNAESASCESCHGPGAAHAEDGETALIYNPKTGYNAAEPNNCLSCHQGGSFESESHTAHWDVANGCSDCHTIHSDAPKLLAKQEEKLCVDCHQDIMAQMMLPSHHPVKEGLMKCTDCHNVHGEKSTFASTDNYNDMCYSCHPAKEGPFVYEHQPVEEDCRTCHTPHGSVANNLLTQNEPALCMSCHPVHFHTGIQGMDGEFTAPIYPTRGGVSTTEGFKSGMMTKCTQCHVAVHGSDMPSQGTTSHGKSLTR
jgi:DmsE family decaheme c-type cytochrome